MLELRERIDLPTWLQALLAAVGLVGLVLSILLIPEDVQTVLRELPFLGKAVPWWLLLSVSMFLLAFVLYYQIFRAKQMQSGAGDTAVTGNDMLVRDVKDIEIIGDEIIVTGSGAEFPAD